MVVGKPEVMRELNKSLILETIRKRGPVSRANLNKMLSLSFPAVSNSVNELLEEGWIMEAQKDCNLIGRKATLLEYNGKKGFVLGVDIGRSHLSILLADVSGQILLEDCVHGAWKDGSEVMDDLICLLHNVLDREAELKNRLMCIGVGIPGSWDHTTQKNVLAPFLKNWENINVQKILETEFGVSVLVDNSVNLGAIGEKWQGKGKNCNHMLYLDFGIGIGSAIILNGELYRGMNGAAGELGYSLPDFSVARKKFSEEGLFEQLLSDHSTVEEGKKDKLSMKDIFIQAEKGEEMAAAFLETIKQYTAVVVVNSVALLNPEKIIFAGSIGIALLKRYHKEFMDILENHVPYVPELDFSQLGRKANTLGAVGIALRNVHGGFNINGDK